MFGKLFSGGSVKVTPDRLVVVRNITIGRTVVLDSLAWRRQPGINFALERDTLEIVAQGFVKLEDGGYVHRFYTDDDIMLQAVSQREDGLDADDFTLFQPWSSTYPTDRSVHDEFFARLSKSAWTEPGLPQFDRFWYEGDTRNQAAVRLWEAVHDDRDGVPDRHIEQTCMLYARELDQDGGLELLLALVMQPEGGDCTHEIMIGLPLSVAEFSA
jgi:Protein of unknown function (DUF2491)